MNTEQILQQLREDRDRLNKAISALESAGPYRMGRPRRTGGGITAAGRRRLSQLMKKRWAERRKQAGKK